MCVSVQGAFSPCVVLTHHKIRLSDNVDYGTKKSNQIRVFKFRQSEAFRNLYTSMYIRECVILCKNPSVNVIFFLFVCVCNNSAQVAR